MKPDLVNISSLGLLSRPLTVDVRYPRVPESPKVVGNALPEDYTPRARFTFTPSYFSGGIGGQGLFGTGTGAPNRFYPKSAYLAFSLTKASLYAVLNGS